MQKIAVPIRDQQLLQLFIIALHKLGGVLTITDRDLLAYRHRQFNVDMFQEAEPDQDGYLVAKDGGDVTIRLGEVELPQIVPGSEYSH